MTKQKIKILYSIELFDDIRYRLIETRNDDVGSVYTIQSWFSSDQDWFTRESSTTFSELSEKFHEIARSFFKER